MTFPFTPVTLTCGHRAFVPWLQATPDREVRCPGVDFEKHGGGQRACVGSVQRVVSVDFSGSGGLGGGLVVTSLAPSGHSLNVERPFDRISVDQATYGGNDGP